MGIPSNYSSVYSVGWPKAANSGNREDLLDIITNISPRETPGVSMFAKTEAVSVLHEWLTDSLAAATATALLLGLDEGRAFVAASAGARTRLANVTQIFGTDFGVTRTEQTLARKGGTAAVKDEYRYQLGKHVLEVGTYIESRIWYNTTATATATASSAPRRMAAIRGFAIITATASATTRPNFATSDFLDMHEVLYSAGAKPDTVMCSAGVKRDMTTAFMGGGLARQTYYAQLSEQRVTLSVDVIESDFGLLALVPNLFVPQATATAAADADSCAYFIFDKSKIRLAFLDPVQHKPLAAQGDSEIGQITGELTLEVLHPSCIGAVTQTIT